MTENFPDLDFKIAFKSPGDIGKLFPFKDKIKNKAMQSLVIYQIKCTTCNASYIGKTERHLQKRLREHNNPTSVDKSAIQMHKNEHPSHNIDPFEAEILDRASDDYKLQMKEWIHIKNRKPTLNTQFARINGNFSQKLKMIIIDHLV